MHSALFVAFPSKDRTKIKNWQAFLTYVDSHVDPAKGVLQLGEGVWLLNLRVSLAPIGQLAACAAEQELCHGILPFEHKPEWLPAGFYPSTILAQTGEP